MCLDLFFNVVIEELINFNCVSNEGGKMRNIAIKTMPADAGSEQFMRNCDSCHSNIFNRWFHCPEKHNENEADAVYVKVFRGLFKQIEKVDPNVEPDETLDICLSCYLNSKLHCCNHDQGGIYEFVPMDAVVETFDNAVFRCCTGLSAFAKTFYIRMTGLPKHYQTTLTKIMIEKFKTLPAGQQ